MGKNVWVTGQPGRGFQVKTEGASRAASKHETQGAAIKAGQQIAERRGSELIVQNTHGQIRSKDSYGNDPRSKKDREH